MAAASLAEVYRANLPDGTPVAVKVQRPGLERKVALDFYVMRRILALVQARFELGEDVQQVVAVLDEVGASIEPPPQPRSAEASPPRPRQVGEGIFAELDFATEARLHPDPDPKPEPRPNPDPSPQPPAPSPQPPASSS